MGRSIWRSQPLSPANSLLLSAATLSPPTAPAKPPPGSLLRRHRPHSLASSSSRPAAAVLRALPLPAAALAQDLAAASLVLAGAYSLVHAFDVLSRRQLVEQSLSRKIVHVLSGVLFVSSWPFFSSSVEARYFASVAPLLNFIRLLSYGLRLVKDEALVKSITREGKPEELLRGPLYYVIVLMLCVLVFWRDSPVGIISLSMMSGGDGFADIIGRRYGTLKLPYNSKKSWIGSISMFVSGFLFSIGMLFYFSKFGYMHLDWEKAVVGKVALVSLAATLVESLPISEVLDDNITVPLASMLTAFLLFGPTSR